MFLVKTKAFVRNHLTRIDLLKSGIIEKALVGASDGWIYKKFVSSPFIFQVTFEILKCPTLNTS
jgi:hypothetical protein